MLNENESIFAEGALDRIFIGELIENRRKDGGVEHRAIRGFRHESKEADAAGFRVVEGTREVPDARGVYHAKARAHGVDRKQGKSVFFPRAWTRSEVIAAIETAHANCHQVNPGGRWFMGAGGGLKLSLELYGGKVVDAMPQQSRVSRLRRVLWQFQQTGRTGKHLCRVCHQPKVYVCPEGHSGYQKQRPRTLYSRTRYLVRRVYFGARRHFGGKEGQNE